MAPMSHASRRLGAAAALLVALPLITSVGAPAVSQAAPAPGASAAAKAVTTVVSGKVVRFNNGRPVQGATVRIFDASETDFLGSVTTNAQGNYKATFRGDYEEFGIKIIGPRGFQTGWLGCDRTLKPTFGDACTFGVNVPTARIKAS